MENQKYYRIVPLEIAVVMFSVIFGVAILRMPAKLVEVIGTADGWISMLLAGIVSMFFVWAYVYIQRKFPHQTLFEYLEQGPIGKWASKVLLFAIALQMLLILIYEMRIISKAIKLYLLPATPQEILVALILLLITYAAKKGIQGIIHLCLLFTPIFLFNLLLLLLLNMPNYDFEFVQPVLAEGLAPVLRGFLPSFFVFTGIKLLFFLMKNMKASELQAKPIIITHGIAAILYAAIIFFCYSIFTYQQSGLLTFPTIEMAKEIELAGGFVARLESLFITVWFLGAFTSMILVFLVFELSTKGLFKIKQEKRWFIGLLVFITYVGSFIPKSINELTILATFLAISGASILTIGILFGFVTVWFRSRKTQGIEKEG